MKAISSNKNNKLEEGQVFIHNIRSGNIHGLIRNIFYFKDKNKATINSTVVLQYYINRKNCRDKEEVQYTAPNQGNSSAEKPFFAIKKSTFQNFKKQVNQKGKQVISVLCDNVTQMRNEVNDYRDLPKSKNYLKDY